MLLILHIIVGIASIGTGLAAYFKVSRDLIESQIALFLVTIVSGVALVYMTPQTMVHFCISGVIFSLITLTLLVLSKRKVATTAAEYDTASGA